MGKSFSILLVFVIIFLAGMLYGMEREGTVRKDLVDETDVIYKEIRESDGKEINERDEADLEINQTYSMNELETKEHFTQKVASVIEIGVKGFYEIVVNIMYQFAKLFY